MPSDMLALYILGACFFSAVSADICYASDQRGLILRDHLYFMAGTYLRSNDKELTSQSALYSLDLKGNFTVEGHLDENFVHNTTVSTTPYGAGGVFLADLNQTILYTMGGFGDPDTSGQSTIQGYEIGDHVWQSISVSGGEFNKYDRYPSMHASSFGGGGSLSFIAGGQDYLTGMIIFNSSNPLSPSWENVTDGSTPYFFSATTQYVRFGDAGVLVSVGGFITESTTERVAQRREMNSIQVYDIAARKWFTIFATGDIPPPRSRSCSALSAASDDSSFQMILHGGWDERNALGDVYVLTMPAFHWIKTASFSAENSSMPRMNHFCSTYQDRQMLIIGGRNQLNVDSSDVSCDDGYPALRMLDTTTFQWQKHYPLQDIKYRVPQVVIDVIGGGPDGGGRPASAFSQTLGDYVAVFNKTISRYDPDHPPQKIVNTTSSPTPTPSSSLSSSPTTSPSPARSSSTHTGIIAGTTIGGVCGALVLGVAIWVFLVRQYRQRRKDKEPQNWQKAELHGHTGASIQPKHVKVMHEAQGDHPVKLDPSEIDTERERVEAPGQLPIQMHELEGGNLQKSSI